MSSLTLDQTESLGDITADRVIDSEDYASFRASLVDLNGIRRACVAVLHGVSGPGAGGAGDNRDAEGLGSRADLPRDRQHVKELMNEQAALSEYLVISRGQWDKDASREDVQQAIDQFYVWLERLVAEGKMKTGQRLASEGKTVSRDRPVTDGPFGETKEVIGGYWFILASSLDEAASIASGNPCLRCGLFYEIRPIEPVRASAFAVTTETPLERR